MQLGLPHILPDSMTLYLSVAVGKTAQTIDESLRQHELVALHLDQQICAVHVDAAQLAALSSTWSQALSPSERQSIKCYLSLSSDEPSLPDLIQSHTLQEILTWVDGQWLESILRDGRLTTYFQPIVRCEEPTEVFGYECLLRGLEKDGSVVSPERLYSVARSSDLLVELDEAARHKAIESTSDKQLNAYIFININPLSLDDMERRLEAAICGASAAGLQIDQLVFEVVESEGVADAQQLVQMMEFCRSRGCHIALDDFGAGYNSLNLLTLIKPQFIKLDMGLIRDVDQDFYKGRVAGKLLELAQELEIITVVEGVETVSEWHWVTEHGADLAQGFLFSRPQQLPPLPRSPLRDTRSQSKQRQLLGVSNRK